MMGSLIDQKAGRGDRVMGSGKKGLLPGYFRTIGGIFSLSKAPILSVQGNF